MSRDRVFGERNVEVLRTWRSGRLKGLKDSIELYGKEHGLDRKDYITLAHISAAYRYAVKQETIKRSALY